MNANGQTTLINRRKGKRTHGRRKSAQGLNSSHSAQNRFIQNHIELLPKQERLEIQAQIYSFGNLVNENFSYYAKKHR